MSITSYHHTGVVVKDLDRSIQFWVNVLGFKTLARFQADPDVDRELAEAGQKMIGIPGCIAQEAHLLAPDGRSDIQLTQMLSGYPPAEDPRNAYQDHLSVHFAMKTDNIEELHEKLLKAGCTDVGGIVTYFGGVLKVMLMRGLDNEMFEFLQGDIPFDAEKKPI